MKICVSALTTNLKNYKEKIMNILEDQDDVTKTQMYHKFYYNNAKICNDYLDNLIKKNSIQLVYIIFYFLEFRLI